MRRFLAAACGVLASAGLAAGCAGDDVGTSVSDVRELKDLYRDGRNLDLNDLLSVSAGYATDQLNDLLAVSDYGSLELSPVELYALAADAQNDLTLHDLDGLVSGLVTQFGERELTTEVNDVRRRYLASSGDVVYGESAFSINASHGWSHDVGGWDEGSVAVGFDLGGQLQARLISAYGSEWQATVGSPLEAAKASRGFVLPRSVADMRNMKPGESYALRGSGRLGFNLGLGVPILTTVVNAVSYSVVLSAGLRTLLEGQVDVQVVRLEGDEIVIDVGVEQSSTRQARVALSDGWGVHGLLQQNISLGGFSLDLGRLVEKALQKQLNSKLQLVNASLDNTSLRSRLSVARFRVNLDAATPDSPLDKALAQLLHADLRLAQALANRYEPGILAEFELSRSGVSSTSYAGIDILGMSFFRKLQESQGSIVVQTPGGAAALYFESLHKESGWFFSSHGYARVGLSGMFFDPENPEGANGQANLMLQIVEGDDFMERDKLLDHLDGVILGIGGEAALAAIEGPGNELERFVEAACPNSQAFDPCREEVLSNPTVIQLRQDGLAALGQALTGADVQLAQLALAAGELRLTAQATYEPKASLVGPPTSIVVDYRLDDRALQSVLAERTTTDLRQALQAYLRASAIDRIDPPETIAADRTEIVANNQVLAAAVATVFEQRSARYRDLVDAESLTLPAHPELGEMGSSAIEIRFPVDGQKNVLYEEAVAGSLAQARSRVATALFDDLVATVKAESKGLGYPEQVVAYTLLALTPSRSVDLRIDVDMDLENSFSQSYDHYVAAGYENLDQYGRGADVSPIDGGLFNLDTLLNLQ